MLPAVQLYHDHPLDTGKVRDVFPYRVLAAETLDTELLSS
jgi:hypothetical protein